jgi:serine/threonine-protein kinase
MPNPSGRDLKIGDVLDRKYVLRERIGEGGMGVVFLAMQATLGRPVAIKVLQRKLAGERQFALRLLHEAILASRIVHPRSVNVIDTGVLADGSPYIVMEHVTGRPLARVVSEEHIPIARACDLALQILDAVEAIHGGGVVHADIKCANFLIDDASGADRVKLIDFGLARAQGASLDPWARGTRSVSGTPEYMAPEIIRGDEPSVASDLYAVGVILYELLTGTTPFSGGTSEQVMMSHLDELVVPPSLRCPDREIPDAIDRVVLRALDKQPAARFADATEFANELRAAMPARRQARRRFARGSAVREIVKSPRAQELDRAIGEAIVRGDIDAIATGYRELARELANEQRFAAAVCELQEGIDLLSVGCSAGSGPVNQLVTALAALYEEAGERARARRTAASVDGHPTLASA